MSDKPTRRSLELEVAQTMLDRKVERADELLSRDKPTEALTDEQIDAEIAQMGRGYRPWELRAVCRRIEAIVRKDAQEKCEETIRELVRKMRGEK